MGLSLRGRHEEHAYHLIGPCSYYIPNRRCETSVFFCNVAYFSVKANNSCRSRLLNVILLWRKFIVNNKKESLMPPTLAADANLTVGMPTLPKLTDDQRKFIAKIGTAGISKVGEQVFGYIKLAATGTEAAREEFRSKANASIRALGPEAQAYLAARFADVDRWH